MANIGTPNNTTTNAQRKYNSAGETHLLTENNTRITSDNTGYNNIGDSQGIN